MKKIVVIICFILLPKIYLAEDNHFYLDTPIEGIYTMMDKVTKVAANYVKPVRKVETGEYVYCVTPGIAINPNGNYEKIDSNQWDTLNISQETFERIQLISYYGYMYGNHTDLKWYAVTQYLIWQEVMPDGWSVYFTNTLRGPKSSDFDWMINELESLVDSYYTRPNIKSIIEGNYKNDLSFYDKNHALHNYKSNSKNVIINNDSMILKPSNEDYSFSLEYNTDNKKSSLYIYDDAQWVVSVGSPPKKILNYQVFIPKGSLHITKEVENIEKIDINYKVNLQNAIYRIFNDNYDEIYSIDANGIIDIANLNVDTYYIKEISAPVGLKIDNNLYTIEIKADTKSDIILTDDLIIGQINIFKEYLDLENNEFKPENDAIFAILDNDDSILTSKSTDEEGRVSFILPSGTYIVSQIKGLDNYELIKNEEVEVFDNTIDLNYYNRPLVQPLKEIDIENNIIKPIENSLENINNVEKDQIFKIKNPQTNDNIISQLILLGVSIIMFNIIFCKNLIKKKEITRK